MNIRFVPIEGKRSHLIEVDGVAGGTEFAAIQNYGGRFLLSDASWEINRDPPIGPVWLSGAAAADLRAANVWGVRWNTWSDPWHTVSMNTLTPTFLRLLDEPPTVNWTYLPPEAGLKRAYHLTRTCERLYGERVVASWYTSVEEEMGDDYIFHRYDFTTPLGSCTSPIDDELRWWHTNLSETIALANQAHALSMRHGDLERPFCFPESVRAACEQYLVYFTQFLCDLGIQATADIQHIPGVVLFSVTPHDEHTALNTIREALDVYLKLPGVSDLEAISLPYTDTAVIQLRANVLHLKAQLYLAQAVLEAKDATIEAQALSILQYRTMLGDKAPLRNSAEYSADQRTDEEALIGDLVTVKPLEIRGFLKLNLPEWLRRLKRRA